MKNNQFNLNTIRGLFLLFKETHEPERACIILSESFKIPVEILKNMLKKEIEDCSPIKSLGVINKKG